MIIVQTPLRVSFLGGGTDFPDYYLREGGCVLTTAIDKYIFVTIKRRFDQLLRVGYTQTEMVSQLDEIQHNLIREAFRLTDLQAGVEITTMGDIPSQGSGLGSSSTVTVGALHAMYALQGELVSAETLAQQACQIELDILGRPAGVQDQYIAAFGGLRFIEFCQDGRICVQRISLTESQVRRLNENTMLFYTGVTRQSSSILSEQKTKIRHTGDALSGLSALARQGHAALLAGDLDALGELLHENWRLKKRLAGKITNPSIDALYEQARDAGALGGKISGAGGGGFLLLYCRPDKQTAVRSALSSLRELPFRIEPDGSKVIFNYQRS